MRYQYVVVLKKDSEKTTDILSFVLCLSSAIFFLFAAISSFLTTSPVIRQTWFDAIIGLILLLGVIVNLISRRKGYNRVRFRWLLIVGAIGWLGSFLMPYLAIPFVLLAFLEYQTKRPLEIGFDKDRVVINTLIRQTYDWSAFSNVILRDGLLTMDFRNNRLFQKEVVDDEDDDDADEEEFNDYCRARLHESLVK